MKLVLFADGVVGMQIAEYLAEKYPQDLSLVVTVAENEIFDFAQAVRVSACVAVRGGRAVGADCRIRKCVD